MHNIKDITDALGGDLTKLKNKIERGTSGYQKFVILVRFVQEDLSEMFALEEDAS